MYIAVIGASVCNKDTGETAYEVGKEIANAGHVLICGGLTGVMEYAAKGAFEAGGFTIGILPGTCKKDANPYIKVAVATGLGEARNAIIARTADALIAIDGEFGTLSEIALGLKMGKKVIGIGTWQLFKGNKESYEIQKADSSKQAVKMATENITPI